MEFFKKQTNLDFIRMRKKAYVLTLLMIMLSLGSLAFRGLNLGIDFTGGTLVEIGFPRTVATSDLAEQLNRAGFGGVTIQHFGSDRDVLVRIPPQAQVDKEKLEGQLTTALHSATGPQPEIRRLEFVGPQVGDELVEKGGLAVLFALGGIAVYIWMRFERRFALGALAATVHDAVLTIGYFSLTGTQFDLTVLAAVLSVIGYSVNDTIVVFDRIRDNLRKMRKLAPADVANISINQTMSRTLMTAGTTLLVVFALFFGGPTLHGFAVALLIGILVGTYSSIYVASAVALDLGLNRSDLLPVDKETGKPVEELP